MQRFTMIWFDNSSDSQGRELVNGLIAKLSHTVLDVADGPSALEYFGIKRSEGEIGWKLLEQKLTDNKEEHIVVAADAATFGQIARIASMLAAAAILRDVHSDPYSASHESHCAPRQWKYSIVQMYAVYGSEDVGPLLYGDELAAVQSMLR